MKTLRSLNPLESLISDSVTVIHLDYIHLERLVCDVHGGLSFLLNTEQISSETARCSDILASVSTNHHDPAPTHPSSVTILTSDKSKKAKYREKIVHNLNGLKLFYIRLYWLLQCKPLLNL